MLVGLLTTLWASTPRTTRFPEIHSSLQETRATIIYRNSGPARSSANSSSTSGLSWTRSRKCSTTTSPWQV